MSDDAAILQARQVMAAAATQRMLQGVMNQRSTYVEQMRERQVREGQLRGFVPMANAGETDVQVDFPMVFLEKPIFTCGLELDANQSISYGSFPIGSATVLNWITRTASGDRLSYIGARIGVVVIGPAALKTILHYCFAGRSFTDGIGTTSVAGTI